MDRPGTERAETTPAAHRGRGSEGALTVAPGWQAALASNGWNTLDDLFKLKTDARLTKPGLPRWRERLRVGLTDASGGSIVGYIKRYRRPPVRQQMRRWWGSTPTHATAWTEWQWLHRLAVAGIPAPEPIACGEEMLGPWERRSAVVMREVQGISLERWCTRHERSLPGPVAAALASLVGRLHAGGLAHRDLYLSHVFVDDAEAPDPRLCLIDLQRVLEARGVRRWLVKDLAALNYSTPASAASPRDRVRWLKQYLRLSGAAPSRAHSRPLSRRDRVLARWVMGKTEQIRRHAQRRCRRGP